MERDGESVVTAVDHVQEQARWIVALARQQHSLYLLRLLTQQFQRQLALVEVRGEERSRADGKEEIPVRREQEWFGAGATTLQENSLVAFERKPVRHIGYDLAVFGVHEPDVKRGGLVWDVYVSVDRRTVWWNCGDRRSWSGRVDGARQIGVTFSSVIGGHQIGASGNSAETIMTSFIRGDHWLWPGVWAQVCSRYLYGRGRTASFVEHIAADRRGREDVVLRHNVREGDEGK